jgi:starch-binding outer membrane protein, SusD/RagB family
MKISRIHRYIRPRFGVLLLACVLQGCDALVDVDPPGTRPSPELIFQDDLTATSAVRGMYSEMSSQPYFTNAGISLLSSLSGDDMKVLETTNEFNEQLALEANSISQNNSLIKKYCWQPGYRYIYVANSILEGLAASKGVTSAMKNQLRAEALFVRAFSTFYLTNLFGSIPLPATTELAKNMHISRSSSEDAYRTIVADLLEAKQLFSVRRDFSFIGDQYPRSRASYWSATALLARVYLYQEKWQEAELQAAEVLEQPLFFRIYEDLDSVFLALPRDTSQEVIWQLLPIGRSGSVDAELFVPEAGKKPAVYLTESFLSSIESNDQRATHWIGAETVSDTVYRFSNKYAPPFGGEKFHVELRLAEVLLIRAEARARQGNLLGAIDDVDILRNRAGLTTFKGQSLDRDALLQKIAQERRVELFAEGGHRWLDLKRTHQASLTLPLIDYKKWEDTDELYPVPQSEILNNPNLGPQNRGY